VCVCVSGGADDCILNATDAMPTIQMNDGSAY